MSFLIKEGSALNIAADASVSFTLSTDSKILTIGDNVTATVAFSENFITPEATVSADIGGSLRGNHAYIDFNAGTTTSINRNDYDLALESSGSGFNILLNSSALMMAHDTDKSDFTSVSSDDLDGVVWQGDTHGDIVPDAAIFSGDFTETRLYQWDASGNTSNVFIIDRGEQDKDGESRGMKKVQITKSGDTYTVHSADLDGSNDAEYTITKSTDVVFKFVHFDSGEATVEPDSWDFVVRTTAQVASSGGVYYGTYNTVGAFQNYHGGVEVAAITADETEFDDITLASAQSAISGSSSDLTAIGFDWRSLDFATFKYVITDGLTYVFKDAEGNYF